MIELTSLYTGLDGESHFRELKLKMKGKDGIVTISDYVKTQPMFFIEGEAASKDPDPHCAPRRQLIIILEGELEVELKNGEKRLFSPGQTLLAEDTSGSGHVSRPKNRKALVIPLAEGELTE